MSNPACSAATLFQHFVQIDARTFHGWREPEENPGEKRNNEREDQNSPIERNFARAWQATRQYVQDRLRSQRRDQNSERSAYARKKNALRQQLTNDSSWTCSQCRAHREFTSSAYRPCEQKICHVRASD